MVETVLAEVGNAQGLYDTCVYPWVFGVESCFRRSPKIHNGGPVANYRHALRQRAALEEHTQEHLHILAYGGIARAHAFIGVNIPGVYMPHSIAPDTHFNGKTAKSTYNCAARVRWWMVDSIGADMEDHVVSQIIQ